VWLGDLSKLPTIRLIGDVIRGKRLMGELDRERLAIPPERCSPSCQAARSRDAPVPETHRTSAITTPTEARRPEDTVGFCRLPHRSTHPPQDVSRAVPLVLAITVCPMDVLVIVSDEAIVRSTQFRPRLHFFDMPVGPTPLDMEVGLASLD